MKSFFSKSLMLGGMVMAVSILAGSSAYAHVAVKPSEVPTASYQTFTVSVPNESDTATTKVKLEIPAGVTGVTPTVKNGWKISTATSKDKAATVKSITWKNGSIGHGLRDDFTFSAKTADSPTELQWKAYQTYSDGTVVSWDGADDSGHGGDSGPFSVTRVVNQDTDASEANSAAVQDAQKTARYALYIAIASLLAGLAAIFFGTRRS